MKCLLPLINRQIYFALVGIVLIFIVAAIDYRYWMALYRPIVHRDESAALCLVPQRAGSVWCSALVSVGVLFLQPTEFAKIAAILLLARYFDKTQNQPRDLRWIIVMRFCG